MVVRIDFNRTLEHFKDGYLPPDVKVVLLLQELLERHFREEHDPKFYVQRVGMSERRLNGLLKKFLGRTIYQLIQDRIHEEAVKLLLYTTLTVKEISYGLGVCHPSWFSRHFRKLTGLNPRQYRVKFRVENMFS
ncbi:AraC family transcriptional regulator [Pedobacter nutrimenti]|uniref:helix-turn-helix domain-containing protein n=1 Tax=Pedobacter nutrimenti TaxID=1241337 RepID=UPI00292F9152|nr:AraC family transcriptional regulator [Pedobacter nutrimenti]